MKKMLSMLLCACLLLSLLAGCAGPAPAPTPEPTAAPTPAPTPEPTPEPLDAPQLYRDAAEQLSAGNLNVRYTITQEITLPDYTGETLGTLTLREETARSAAYEALGDEGFIADVSDTVQLGDGEAATQRQVYSDGAVYLEFGEGRYVIKRSAEEFMDEQLPLALLDPALYASAEAERTEEGIALRFAGAEEGEAWALPEDSELLSTAASASLTEGGALIAESYEASYRFGGLEVSTRWEAAYEVPGEQDLSAGVPENAKKYESLDSAAAPLMLWRALRLLEGADNLAVSMISNYQVDAAATTIRNYNNFNILLPEEGILIHQEINQNTVNYSEMQAVQYGVELDYADGVMTLTFDDGDVETEEMEDEEIAESTERLVSTLPALIPAGGDLVDAEVKEVGDYWLLEFSGNENYGLQLKDRVCLELFDEQASILDDHASAYRTKTAEGFLAVEKVSGLPTALNISFTGIHTIENTPCELNLEMNAGISLYTDDAYGEIFDEPLAGPEPENKPTPVFYEVSDEEGNSMYLFGTIHVGDDRTAWLPQVIYDALDEAEALAVEFDTEAFSDSLDVDDELRRVVMEAYYYTDGTEIRNHLDSETYKSALDYMKVSGSYDDTAENVKPYLWSNAIELFYLAQGRKLCADKGVDNRLMRLAKAAGKEVLDVESGEFQVSMFGNYTDPVQEMLLIGTVEYSRAEYIQSTMELFEAWCEGDEAALIERLAAMDEEERAELDEDEQAIYDEYHQKMEVERNANMTEVAIGYLQSGKKVFFAVGLAHLLGEGGLVQALRDAGYTVTLIDTH